MRRIIIVGAGWAGLSAAIAATQAGWQVHLYEAAKYAGGRARRIPKCFDHQALDNGQHILIGAYRETLRLMRLVGIDLAQAFDRRALDLRQIDGKGFKLTQHPFPWNLLLGLVTTQGWSWRDKWELIKAGHVWQRRGFQCPPSWTVEQLCDAAKLGGRIRRDLIEPLCVSALNTEFRQASASVFLRVLQDAMLADPHGMDVYLPKQDMSAVFVDAALDWLTQRGAQLHFAHRMHPQELTQLAHPILLACAAWDAARLTHNLAPAWSAQAKGLTHEAIATVYLHTRDALAHVKPMLALSAPPHPALRPVAQFVFNREVLTQQKGLLAAVVSACELDNPELEERVCQQVKAELGLQHLAVVQCVMEKRATLRMTPELKRPGAHIHANWWACGDYIEGPYPSTLEGAVRNGQNVVNQLIVPS